MSYSKYKDLGKKEDDGPIKPVLEIQHLKHKQDLINGYKLCVIDIWGSWCGPCKSIAPKFSKLAHTYYKPGVCILAKEDATLALSPDVKGVPTFQFYQNGKLIHKITGADISGVEAKIKELLGIGALTPPLY